MKYKHLKLPILVLGCLIVLSFAFFSYAQEKAVTDKNVFLDSDQDGLSDQEEKLYGTDPHNPDTDGDGYTDGAEVKAGYDPTKPAPGDKIVTKEETLVTSSANTANTTNLTEELTSKIAAAQNSTDPESQGTSLTDLQSMVGEALSASQIDTTDLPTISKDEIKIKKQNYSKLSDAARKTKEKEDFVQYTSALSYIFSSNYPKPITSSDGIQTALNSIAQDFASAFAARNPVVLDSLYQSLGKTLTQMKEIEVPETLVPLHTEALQLIMYATSLRDAIVQNNDDPLMDVANMSKMSGLSDSLTTFANDFQNKLTEYEIDSTQLFSDQSNKAATTN